MMSSLGRYLSNQQETNRYQFISIKELHAAHQNMSPAIRTLLRVKEPYKICTENEHSLTIVVLTYNVHVSWGQIS